MPLPCGGCFSPLCLTNGSRAQSNKIQEDNIKVHPTVPPTGQKVTPSPFSFSSLALPRTLPSDSDYKRASLARISSRLNELHTEPTGRSKPLAERQPTPTFAYNELGGSKVTGLHRTHPFAYPHPLPPPPPLSRINIPFTYSSLPPPPPLPPIDIPFGYPPPPPPPPVPLQYAPNNAYERDKFTHINLPRTPKPSAAEDYLVIRTSNRVERSGRSELESGYVDATAEDELSRASGAMTMLHSRWSDGPVQPESGTGMRRRAHSGSWRTRSTPTEGFDVIWGGEVEVEKYPDGVYVEVEIDDWAVVLKHSFGHMS